MGAAIEVPPVRMYCPPTTQLGHMLANALFGANTETMWAPGAYRSGFWTPSWVVPWLDQVAATSSPGSAVPFSSAAPTVITYGSLAGAYWTASAALPRLPAAATTTIPCIQAASAAASSGSVVYDCGVLESSDRLTTRML